MHLLLIRHGQTPSNVLGLLDTAAPGPALTDLGHRQAARIPQSLGGRDVHGIYVSTLRRTHQTAAPLAAAHGIVPVPLPGVHEIEAGDLEMRADRAAYVTYLQTVFAWGAGDLAPRMPGGSDGAEFFARFDADVAAIESAGHENAVVVGHGAAIRVWTAGRVTNVTPDEIGQRELDNTGVIELEGSMTDGWRLISWHDAPIGSARRLGNDDEDPRP